MTTPIDATFTLAALAGDAYPSYHIELLAPGDYTLSQVRHADDKWNAYIRKPTVPAQRYANHMRVWDLVSYGTMLKGRAGGKRPAPKPITMFECGVLGRPSVDETFAAFGHNWFQLLAGPVRPIMFAIYVGLSTQHSNGITLRLQSGHVAA